MGDFIPAQPVDQQYQNDNQFYDQQNGGGFDNFNQSNIDDEINDELDKLLGNEATPNNGGQGNAPVEDSRFSQFLEEQRQQREYDRQQQQSRQTQEQRDNQERTSQLERERIKNEAEAKAKGYRPQFQQVALTEDQKKAYADADPYIRSVINEVLGTIWDSSITPALADHQQSILDLAKRPTQVSMSVEQQVALSRPNVNSIAAEPEFARYLAEPVEGTGMTRRDLMNVAYQRSDVGSVITMLDAYSAAKDKNRPQRSATPNGSVHSAPQGGQGGQQRRVRPYSDLAKAQAQFRQGLITRDKYVQIENHFEALASNGLVDYNK